MASKSSSINLEKCSQYEGKTLMFIPQKSSELTVIRFSLKQCFEINLAQTKLIVLLDTLLSKFGLLSFKSILPGYEHHQSDENLSSHYDNTPMKYTAFFRLCKRQFSDKSVILFLFPTKTLLLCVRIEIRKIMYTPVNPSFVM